jgi:hypothetical protein
LSFKKAGKGKPIENEKGGRLQELTYQRKTRL